MTAVYAATLDRTGCILLCPPGSEPPPAPDPLPAFTKAETCHPTAAQRRGSDRTQALTLGLNAALRFFVPNHQFCPRLALARASGARILREDFEWADVERVKGIYDWRRYDAIVIGAAHYGMTILPILDTTPAWAGQSLWDMHFALGRFAQFVARAVSRYGPGGSFWRSHPSEAAYAPKWFEIWNEPYQPAFSGGQPNPARYARLVRAAVIAGRHANSQAKFLIEAEYAYVTAAGYSAWVDPMYAAVRDLNRYFDGIAVHPYSSTGFSPTDSAANQPRQFETTRIVDIDRNFARHGARSRPMWITEIGWPTCSGFPNCVTTAMQESYLAELLALVRTAWRRFVRVVIVYELEDGYPGSNTADQTSFGLLRYGGARKPAWYKFRTLASAMR